MPSLPRTTPTADEPPEPRSPREGAGRHVIVDGLRLWVRTWPGEGSPLMLLHGGMAHSGWWDTLAPELTPCCRPHAFDRRGHGESEWADPTRYGWGRGLAGGGTV